MPVTNILPGMGQTNNIMSPLIPFNMIVDTDVGLLSLVLKEYMDPTIFDPLFFKNKTVSQLVYELYTREIENPLSLCIRDEYRDIMDDFYNQFMDREYEKILGKSVITEFYRLVRAYDREPEINVTIVCEKQIEMDLLKQYENTKNCRIILSEEIDSEVISMHNQFYFKSIADTIPYTKYLINKSIYIANYGFNKDKDGGFAHPLIEILSMNNVINIIDVFDVSKIKKEN